MSKVIKIKPADSAASNRSSENICMRRRYGAECPVYTHPSDDYVLDHILHAAVAKFTGGISPASLIIAGFDWWEHLLFSPSKLQMLSQSIFDKTAQISQYTMQAASGVETDPIIIPPPADRRFTSDGWKSWPFNVFEQNFLLTQAWWDEATTGVRGVSRHHEDVTSFIARQLLDMVSPSNFPLTNPDILATTQTQGGANFWHGMFNWLDDTERTHADKPPVGAESFVLGENIGCTAGKVVLRNHLIELIQYTPTTVEVYAEPILITPAWIMKYYILDLSPHNSLVKYLVDKGHTVFMISWRNPDLCDRDVSLEDYLHMGIGEALKAVKAITNAPQIHAMGYCLGGTLLSIMAAKLARDGDASLKTLTFLASQVDFEEAGELLLFVDDSQLAFLEDVMWQQGSLDKFQMAGAFQMLRSNDLIWSRMITDYMQGKRQPMFDLMAWNADATRMPYRMHSEYLRELFLQNDLAEGRFMVDGKPVALQDIRTPMFSVGTVRDHVAPWKSVYKILLLTESDVTFVLTSGGHNAGIVSEPGHKGRSYQISTMPSTARYMAPGQWQTTTPTKDGSWWEEWQNWLDMHSSGKIKALAMGSKEYAAIEDAPGSYVRMP
jgi:polyhydroxyalkanoate synthase